MFFNNIKSGFTLVELSIVLVIIGLLIGGILAAQSMIRTARLHKFIGEVQQTDVAVANFQAKYGTLPGDSPALGCVPAALNRCNNSVLEDSDATVNDAMYFDAEFANFWRDLQISGFINSDGTYSPTILGNFKVTGVSKNSPLISSGKNTGMTAYKFNAIHSYLLGDFTSSNNASTIFADGNTPVESIPVMDAVSIDLKIDNGHSDNLDLHNHNVLDRVAMPYQCSTSGEYDLANPDAKCVL